MSWANALRVMGIVLALLWIIQFYNHSRDYEVGRRFGIRPRTKQGLIAIPISPFLHISYKHVTGNSGLLLPLGFLGLIDSPWIFAFATLIIMATDGFGVWLTGGSESSVVGASGVVYGWLGYLILRGFFNGNQVQIAIGIVLFLLLKRSFKGLLPNKEVSWQGHLFGFLGGALAAYIFSLLFD